MKLSNPSICVAFPLLSELFPHAQFHAPNVPFTPLSPFSLPPIHPEFVRHTELVEAEDEDRLVDLEAKDLRLDERERLAVDLDETLALLAVGDGSGGLLLSEALD